MALGVALAGTGGLSALTGTASAHGLTAFRDAFIGNDDDKTGLGSKGWLFFAKDTGVIYFHDGSSWQPLDIVGQLVDTDNDDLLEAPDHDGVDVGTVQADSVTSNGVSTEQLSVSEAGGEAYLSSDQTVPTNTVTKVEIDTAVGSWAALDASNHKVVVQTDGHYLIAGSVTYARNSNWSDGNQIQSRLYVNGTNIDYGRTLKSGVRFQKSATQPHLRKLTTGDEIDLRTRQTSGAEQTLVSGRPETSLTVAKIG